MIFRNIMIEEKKLKEILRKLPHSPGIYKMLDKEGKVIYIGKAKELDKRVKQYFQKNYAHSTRTKKLLENISDIEFTTVDTELEAMILEHSLIKQFLPKYNVIMKDDKSYVYIKITKEDFPRVQIVRKIQKDNAYYIGPKTAAHKVNDTFIILKKIFPFRHCNLDIEMIKENSKEPHEIKVSNRTIKYPCLDFYIKRCIAPCIGKCTKEEYSGIIENVKRFLEGKPDNIVKDLREKMMLAANKKDFERAGKIRDQIQKIESILEKQKISDPNQEDKDIINYIIIKESAYFNLFQIRNGKLLGQENFILTAKELDDNTQDNEVLEAFMTQYYELATDIPKEILIPHETENTEKINIFLKKISDKSVLITVPQRGDKNKLLEMSLNNAKIFADRNKPSWQEESEDTKSALEALQKTLKLKNPIKRLECYDISHLSGTDTVGSMIVFENGIPKNNMYRKFKLRTVIDTPDDYKSMEEVLTRRFSKISSEMKNQEYTFKKSTQKYTKEILKQEKETMKENKLTIKDFYILEKNIKGKTSIAGLAAVKNLSPKVSQIFGLFINPKERGAKLGHKLLKGIIEKAKAKRVYLICKPELLDYYLTLGFEQINKLPEEITLNCDICSINEYKKKLFIVYDKLKHPKDESFEKIPDLIIVDGGKGQLSVASKVLKDLEIDIPHISIAKQFEEIYTPNSSAPILIDKTSPTLHLLQRARDEAHRFAITYNKDLREKRMKA